MAKVDTFEILNHGWDHAQYFQGCGTSFTDFDECVTGAGSNAKEAYEDAVESVANMFDVAKLPTRPRGINKKDRVRCECVKEGEGDMCEHYSYVSIRFTTKEPPTCVLTGAQGENPDDCTTRTHTRS